MHIHIPLTPHESPSPSSFDALSVLSIFHILDPSLFLPVSSTAVSQFPLSPSLASAMTILFLCLSPPCFKTGFKIMRFEQESRKEARVRVCAQEEGGYLGLSINFSGKLG